jgi:hypothetical protein
MVSVRLSKGMRPLDGSTDIGDDNIKTNITDFGLKGEEWIRLAQDWNL